MAFTAAKGGNAGALMSAAELKPLLHVARQKPVNCAVAMSKDKVGLIVLHRRTKPKKLLAELKAQAKAGGITLDTTSLRFGHVSVDGASDSGMATFTVNKPAPGPMKRALLEQVRPAGLQRCEIVVDEGLENETDEDGASEGTSRTGPASGPADAEAGSAPPHSGSSQARGSAGPDAPANMSPDGTPTPASQAPASPRAASNATTASGQATLASPAAASADPVRARLAGLGLRAKEALTSDSPQADGIRAAATQARSALASGDMAAAGQAADMMEQLLGTGASGPTAEAAAQESRTALPAGSRGQQQPAQATPQRRNRTRLRRSRRTCSVSCSASPPRLRTRQPGARWSGWARTPRLPSRQATSAEPRRLPRRSVGRCR